MTNHIRRRDFISLLGSAAAAWPVAARAQQRVPVIGVLHTGSADRNVEFLRAFHEGSAKPVLSRAAMISSQGSGVRWLGR
jgi:hypothetical protein